jgi:NADH-quinone oxidoreductase subunit K
MHAVIPYVIAALLFGLGVYGVLRRRNAVLVLMAVELMLNAVNLVFVTADVTTRGENHAGAVFALFIIVLAAAEVGVGLAIVLQLFRLRRGVALDVVELDEQRVAQ